MDIFYIYDTPKAMLDAYYNGLIDFDTILNCFNECGVDSEVDDLTGMIELI